jgi:hypothetical protein
VHLPRQLKATPFLLDEVGFRGIAAVVAQELAGRPVRAIQDFSAFLRDLIDKTINPSIVVRNDKLPDVRVIAILRQLKLTRHEHL